MSLRPTLRTAVLAAVGLGAVLLPSAAAVADDATPTPVPAERTESPSAARQDAKPSEAPTPVPADSVPAGKMPRGGVDAGERPAQGAGDTALYGSAAGAVLLAGAGVLVMRRRSAAQRNG
uniref:Tat pathway signal sequence domain protein n=1 Tax=Streptomyces sp. NBC_01401 TaxID=2903854 RepID=A0AAU3H7K8_9ACTN